MAKSSVSKADSDLGSPDLICDTSGCPDSGDRICFFKQMTTKHGNTLETDSRCGGILQTIGHRTRLRGFCTLQFISSLPVVPFSCLAAVEAKLLPHQRRGEGCLFSKGLVSFFFSPNQIISPMLFRVQLHKRSRQHN